MRSFVMMVVALLSIFAPALAADSRPNIVFIITDDQGPWTIRACEGHPQARTPNMDRLRREGAWLRNAFVNTPVCSPSRASLMTSRYGSELGITDWIHPRKEPNLGLDAALTTWPKLLKQAGYATALIGKWHLGTLDSQHPTNFGYDYFMGFREGGRPPKDPMLEVDGKNGKVEGFIVDIVTDDALRYLDRASKFDRPFMLSVHYREPHARWKPMPEQDWKHFEGIDPKIPNPDYPKLDLDRVKRVTREYLGSIASVDRNVGRILKRLEQHGIVDDTIVIFTSDHGYNMGHNGIWHKGNGHWILTDPPAGTENVPKNQRPNMYDNSLRVPLLVRWPGVVEPGSVVEETVTNLDWFPTLLAMAGVDQPEGIVIRGRNFVPLLKGKQVADWDNDLYTEYSTHHQSQTHMRSYRTPKWKLVRDFNNEGRDELYDLVNDPAETNNLINDSRPEIRSIIRELDARILEKMRELKDSALKHASR